MSFLFKTPPIPDRIKELRLEGYKNIFEYGLGNKNLFGTETLCGDWDGDILIVAKDFAPTSAIKWPKPEFAAFPYQHSPHNQTNILLAELLRENGRDVYLDGRNNLNCGVLYISACFFLKIGDAFSHVLSRKTLEASFPVMAFVVKNMPNLKAIICVGKDAFTSINGFYYHKADWREYLENHRGITLGGVRVFASVHTGKLGVNMRKTGVSRAEKLQLIHEDWKAMFRQIEGN